MFRKITALILAAFLFLLCACSADRQTGVSFVDDLGRSVTVGDVSRTAAAMGSFAELWLLAGGDLVAATEDAISERGLTLEESVRDLGSVKAPCVEVLLESGATFVLLSGDLEGHRSIEETLKACGITCAYFTVDSFEDYLRVLRLCTDLTGKPENYKTYGEDVAARIDAVTSAAAQQEGPTVLLLRAYSSGYKSKGSDLMAGEILQDLGCTNLADEDESLLEDLSMERIMEKDPDWIFVVPMGDPAAAEENLTRTLLSQPAWRTLSAVEAGRFVILPQDLFHYKPNARWAESYEYLAELLYGKD